MKKHISLILAAALAFIHISPAPVFAAAATPPASVFNPAALSAESATLIDADTGQVLFSKNPDQPMFPASTTKALTALIIAEDLKLDEIVTIDKDSPFTSGSRIYVIEGETFTVEQLLYAMLLESANDAAVALAKHHSGTVEQFAKKMNEKAKSLGATHTNFTNPNGLPDPAHLTSSNDLALIGKAFTKHPELMNIVKTYKYDIPPTNKQPETRHLFNSNRFLYGTGSKNKINYNGQAIDIKWEAVTGLKTGFTNAAQQCFIVSATQNGRNLIAVILKAQGNNLYIDPRALLEHGFNDYKPYQFAAKGQLIKSVDLEGSKKAKVDLYTATDVKALIPLAADEKTVTSDVKVNPDIKLPITEGQVLGQLVISYQGQVLTTTDLVSMSVINDKDTLGKDTVRYIQWLPIDQSPKGLTILGLRIAAALILWRLIISKLSGKRRKKRPRSAPRRRPPGTGAEAPQPRPSTSRQAPQSSGRQAVSSSGHQQRPPQQTAPTPRSTRPAPPYGQAPNAQPPRPRQQASTTSQKKSR